MELTSGTILGSSVVLLEMTSGKSGSGSSDELNRSVNVKRPEIMADPNDMTYYKMFF